MVLLDSENASNSIVKVLMSFHISYKHKGATLHNDKKRKLSSFTPTGITTVLAGVKRGVRKRTVSSPDSACSPAPAACVQSHSGQTPSCRWVAPAATAGHGGCPQTPPRAGLGPPGWVTPWCEHVTWRHCATPWRVRRRRRIYQVRSQYQTNILVLLLVLFSKTRRKELLAKLNLL